MRQTYFRSARAFAIKPRAFGAPHTALELDARRGRADYAAVSPMHTLAIFSAAKLLIRQSMSDRSSTGFLKWLGVSSARSNMTPLKFSRLPVLIYFQNPRYGFPADTKYPTPIAVTARPAPATQLSGADPEPATIERQDTIDAALVPPLQRSSDIRHALTVLQRSQSSALCCGVNHIRAVPSIATSSSSKIRRCWSIG